MAAALTEDSSPAKRTYGDLISKRTEAMPKHTLFGSNLEVLDDKQRKQLHELDINKYKNNIDEERKLKQDRYKVTVPPHLRQQIPDECLKYSQQELVDKKIHAKRAEKVLDMLEEKSKYFAVGTRKHQMHSPSHGRDSSWMSGKDLEHAEDMNILGFGGTGSYNHHKFQPKSSSHQYNNMGDPMRLGMDLPVSPSAHIKRNLYRVERMGPPDRMPKEFYMKKEVEDVSDPCTVKLPPNIKHQFGTMICQNVLSDGEKVDRTMEDQRKREQLLLKSAQKRPHKVVLENDVDPAYESLGAALRLDFFPGHTYNHKRSVARSVYTDDVHKQRVADPDQYRYQRDYLSTWAEQNVLREKVKKAWDAYLADTLTKK